MKVSYKGYEIEVTTHGSANAAGPIGRYTGVVIDGIGEIKLDFAAPFYALELSKLAIDTKLQLRSEFRAALIAV